MRRTTCFALIAAACCLWVKPADAQENQTPDTYLSSLKKAEETAESYRAAGADQQPELKTKVIQLVEQSFEARQRAQKSQLEQMRKKLRETEQAIEAREALKQRIIDRKVEDLLSGQSAGWKSVEETEAIAFDVIEIGDVVMVYIEGVLPFTPPNQAPSPPPVNVLRSGRIVTGYPVTVGSDGKIPLPLVDPIKVAGLSVRQAEVAIAKTYTERDILRRDKAKPMLTLVPKAESQFSVVNATENVIIPPPAQSPTALQRVSSGSSSYDDTYGRLEKARQLVEQINASSSNFVEVQGSIQEIQESINKLREETTSDGSRAVKVKSLESRLRSLSATREALRQSSESARFRLALERDYLTDLLERYKTEFSTGQSRLKNAMRTADMYRARYRSGAGDEEDVHTAEAAELNVEASLQKARQNYDQAKRILDRWKKIVGEKLDDEIQASADSAK